MPILTATNIRHAFGDHVILDGVSLSIEPDERIGVVGRNGSGKSTLLRAMAGRSSPMPARFRSGGAAGSGISSRIRSFARA